MLKAGPLKFLLDLVMLLVVLAVLTTVGYLAKVSTALGNFVPGLKAALISPSLHRKKKEALNQEIHAAAEATIRAEGPLACSLGDGEETSPRVSPQASARAGSEKTGENGEGAAALAGLKFVGAEGLLHLSRKHGDAHPSGDVPGRDELPVARPYGVLVEGLSPRPSASAAAARDPPPGGGDVARKLTHLDKISRAKISAHEMLSSVSNTKLYPPNRVYHLRVTPGGIGSRGTFRMDLSEPKHFGWLLLSPNNLNHHMPWAYTNAMKLLILNKEHRRKMARALGEGEARERARPGDRDLRGGAVGRGPLWPLRRAGAVRPHAAELCGLGPGGGLRRDARLGPHGDAGQGRRAA